MRAFISTVTLLWVITIPCMEAIHGLYNFGQHELFYKKNNCKQIPANLLLCHDIEYTEMRLPNLLGHETMNEVLQQASSWIPLVQKQCHPDTRKFLCSLFAPVCLDDLDEPIQPCRSLCESVKRGCAPVMSAFGFPWPKMLDCDRFPLDNDLCIPPAGNDNSVPVTKEVPRVCDACKETDENDNEIVDNLCKNDFALKIKVKEISYINGDTKIVPGDQEQDHLQAERRDGARPEEAGAVAEGRPAVYLRGDERHQRCLPGHGPEDGRPSDHHLAEALAEGAARV
uniref:Secreted frizzled-related protein 2 n=1 Tax=Lates calcarifer TaxID=8187 RepID=A0A4W6EWY6_LATCA